VDPVLLSPAPPCTVDDVRELAARFGLGAASARDLGSERDRTFLLVDADGVGRAVMKVSNSAESADTLDMEAEAVACIGRADAALPVARPWPGPTGTFRDAWQSSLGTHWVRVYDLIPGHARHDPRTLDDGALIEWGSITARLACALRSFNHHRAIRVLPWDVQHAAQCRPMLHAIDDSSARAVVGRILDRFDEAVAPRWPVLRAQVLHGDLSIDNALVDDDGRITGIIDFGDMSYTTLISDLASVLDSVTLGRSRDEMFRAARLVLDGYQRVTPLEPVELDLVGDAWATRVAIGIAIGAWRGREGLEDPDFAERNRDDALAMLDHLLADGWDGLRRTVTGNHDGNSATMSDLVVRRARAFGPAIEPLSYDQPVLMARAEGAFMYDADGTRYLDMYNNVPSVGHSHPRVAGAIARQARTLNTNMRYLHGSAIELAERLTSTCPAALDTVFFVNSGSEANDLAWRMAKQFTGNSGGLCTTFAYHGISDAIAPLSPETLPVELLPAWIDRWAPTDTYRGLHRDATGFAAAIDRLAFRGIAPAMTILDSVLQSDGIYDLDASYVKELVAMTHAAGGLWVADEVQGGHGRTGEAMWSFQRFGIEPDFVTLGKPMGNGHPVAAVITRREIAEAFARDTVFFSTFGGNQVSVAAAHAVLDVLRDERVLPRVVEAGDALRAAVRAATVDVDCVGDVRGMGLANAIEIVVDRQTKTPDRPTTVRIRNGLRAHGVLVGTTGQAGNILKVRPPLAFTAADVPLFVNALSATLAQVSAQPT
jgi:4-aminobutyrate aminotransferase-like enzyme/Ser/Thr protein kinase RdoA (MazF antagonist)